MSERSERTAGTTPIPARPLPRRPVCLPELGFGGAPVANLGQETSDADAAGALAEAWRSGIRYYDTAPHYGLGLGERRLGAALAGRPRSQVLISTKVGRVLEPRADGPQSSDLDDGGFAVPATHRRRWDFTAAGVRRSLEDSLARLRTDRVDVVLLHDPDAHWAQAAGEGLAELVRLRDAGLVGAVGVGMNRSALLARFVRETDVDVVMLAGRYTLLEQGALADVLPAAQERGVAVVAAGVFNSGLLAHDRPPPAVTYDYRPAPARLRARATRLAEVCAAHGTTLPAAALHLVLAHPAVVCAVLGMRTAQEVRRNREIYAARPPASVWSALRAEGLLAAEAPTP